MPADVFRDEHGFPEVPGLLADATRAFTPHGQTVPWFAAHGNHDGPHGGILPASVAARVLAVGDANPVGLPGRLSGEGAVARLAATAPSCRACRPATSPRKPSEENRAAGTAYSVRDLPT